MSGCPPPPAARHPVWGSGPLCPLLHVNHMRSVWGLWDMMELKSSQEPLRWGCVTPGRVWTGQQGDGAPTGLGLGVALRDEFSKASSPLSLCSCLPNKREWSPAAFELGDEGDKSLDSSGPLHPPCLPRAYAGDTPSAQQSDPSVRGSLTPSVCLPRSYVTWAGQVRMAEQRREALRCLSSTATLPHLAPAATWPVPASRPALLLWPMCFASPQLMLSSWRPGSPQAFFQPCLNSWSGS